MERRPSVPNDCGIRRGACTPMIIIDNPAGNTNHPPRYAPHAHTCSAPPSPRGAHPRRGGEEPAHMCSSSHRRLRLGQFSYTSSISSATSSPSSSSSSSSSSSPHRPVPTSSSTATRGGRYRAAGLCLSPLYKLVSSLGAWLLAAAVAGAAAVVAASVAAFAASRVYTRDFPRIFPCASFVFLSSLL